MENLLLLLATTLLFKRSALPPTFQRHYIGHTGSSVCLLSETGEFDKSYTPTDDVLYIHEVEDGPGAYGVIAVDLLEPADSLEHAEGMLGEFMNSLHDIYGIKHHTGLTHGYIQQGYENARGIVDYWQDEEGIDWKVKGWTNGRMVGVLYVKNINEVSVYRQDFFLDSFRFSAL